PSAVEDDFTIYSVDADGTLHEAVKTGDATEIVNLTQAGTLADSLSANAIKAVISGPINGTDVKYLRQLVDEGSLQNIDLSAAKITSGGVAYYESNRTTTNVMGKKMFYKCANLISIRLPENITKIDSEAFANSGIREIVIPDAVTSIGGDAFAYCSQLSQVVVGSKVRSMAQGVFYSSSVKEAFVKVAAPPTIASYLFSSSPLIHVYASSFAKYKASSWNNFGTLVGDLDDYHNITSVLRPEFVEKNAPVYDLYGRKVTKMLPGVMYIRNGKKFINLQ
ncbi:MAG: leucine-rich repeat domain-containing protein, partial [Bacteroidaceae bacterium]|nr:leucine-rich repeat domain-containing protein [Bacteroidaceae bacterium]